MTGEELEKIYNEAYKAVYWTAMSLLKNKADAEDIVQDTFIAFIESYSDLTDTTKATALLKKIAANKCLDRIKLAKTDNMDEEFFDNVEAVPEDFLPDSIVESDEMRKIVMDIINNSLSEDVRRTLILFYFDEMSTKEIAEALGVPQGTVLRRLNFARNKIKKEVEKYEKENDTKLFAMAIPFLSKLFIKESEQVVLKPMPALLSNLSASVKAPSDGAGIKASSKAIKKGTDIMKTKILIGSIAGVVAVGATIGIIAGVMSKKDDRNSHKKPVETTEEYTDPEDDVYADYSDENYTESEVTTGYDVNSINWEDAYKWEGTAIIGLSENFTDEMKEAGIAVIPAKCTEIGIEFSDYPVFQNCSWLKEVRFEKPENITMIGGNVFAECKNLTDFVMPPNACLYVQDAGFADSGCVPFGNTHGSGYTTDLKSLVLPNGVVYIKFLTYLSGDPGAKNQRTLDALYVPENFGIEFSDKDSKLQRFSKFSEEFFNNSDFAGLGRYYKNDGVPCKVYVVKGSWADAHFDEWTYGDMIVKEYWDGVNR